MVLSFHANFQAHFRHESGHPILANPLSVLVELLQNTRTPIGPSTRVEDRLNVLHEHQIVDPASCDWSDQKCMEVAPGDLEDPAHHD